MFGEYCRKTGSRPPSTIWFQNWPKEDSAVAVAFVRMGRSSTGLIPSRETNRLLSLGMAVLNHLRKNESHRKGF